MTRAAVYLRISQDATGEALGVSRQREDCLKLAADQGWDVTEVYTDNDISATSGKTRPSYERMLADIEAGLIDAIVVWSPDRLYRRMKDLERLIEYLEGHSVAVRTVKAGDIDLSSAYGRMIARILGAVATGEGEVKAERWKRSWQQGREAGKFPRTGNRMYGYTRDGQVVPEEAAIVQRMVQHILDGGGYIRLEKWLKDEGILTTKGLPWRVAGVRQYLTNPRLIGKSTLRGEIVGEGEWEPLLTVEQFETVRAILTSRATGVAPVRKNVLTGLIFCGNCGHRMISGRSGRMNRIYRCPSRANMLGCGKVSGNAEGIEGIVEAYAEARLADPRVTARIRELESTGGTSALLTEIADIEARLLELGNSLEQPGVPVDTILRAIGRAKERLAECQGMLADTAKSSVTASAIKTGGKKWPDDLVQKRALLEVALGAERIFLDPTPRNTNTFDVKRVRIEESEAAAGTDGP